MDLRGKVALITGGGTGLGREIALQMAQEGAKLAINYSRSKEDAEKTVLDLRGVGAEAQAFQADLAQVTEGERLVREVGDAFGRLDVLIHNAATTHFIPFPNLDAVTEEVWDNIFTLNTRAAFFLARAAVPLLRADGGGHILFTTSIAGVATTGSSLPYCVSKAALIHLTKTLAVALAPDIQVNAVAPGLLLTRWAAGFSDERVEAMRERALLKKTTDVPDVAAAFVMFAKNGSLTGQNLIVDAGLIGS